MENDWRIWNENKKYGELLHERATGNLDEMESSRALCNILSEFYKPHMKILDVGCGAGHYLRSLRFRLDENINYTGIDATEYYIKLAQKAYDENVCFLQGDIYDLPLEDDSFDVVICNNLILHLPPPPTIPISELIRVSSKYIIIRTVFGQRNYIIKEIRSSDDEIEGLPLKEKNLISSDGKPVKFNYFNMYTDKYIRDIVMSINCNSKIKIDSDYDWNQFDNTALGGQTATKVIGGKQVSGNLLLDWGFIIIEK